MYRVITSDSVEPFLTIAVPETDRCMSVSASLTGLLNIANSCHEEGYVIKATPHVGCCVL